MGFFWYNYEIDLRLVMPPTDFNEGPEFVPQDDPSDLPEIPLSPKRPSLLPGVIKSLILHAVIAGGVISCDEDFSTTEKEGPVSAQEDRKNVDEILAEFEANKIHNAGVIRKIEKQRELYIDSLRMPLI